MTQCIVYFSERMVTNDINTTSPIENPLTNTTRSSELMKVNKSTDETKSESQSFKMPRAPPHVYSCFVVNCTSEPIDCTLKYNGRPGEDKFDEVVNVIIPGNTEHYFPRQLFQPDLPESYCKWVKIITQIRVKKENDQILEVNYPFEHVHCPIRNWEFHVKDEGEIVSTPPTRVVNVLKYENLDRYEC